MSVNSRRIALVAWLWICALPLPCFAQVGARQAQAEALFQRGRELFERGELTEACATFERSDALDSAPGTVLNLAVCYERLGRTASAWLTYRRAAARARATGQAERVEVARKQAERLEPELAWVTVQSEAPTQAGLAVELDGEPLELAGLGTPMPIDPGEHRIVARAPGHHPFETSFFVGGKRAKLQLRIPSLSPLSATREPTTRAQRPHQSPDPLAPAPERSSTQRVSGYVVGGVGLATLGVAGLFGLRMLQKQSQSEEQCDGDVCSPDGAELRREAQSSGDVATVLGLIGVAATATGVVLVLTASDDTRVSTAISLDGVFVRGSF